MKEASSPFLDRLDPDVREALADLTRLGLSPEDCTAWLWEAALPREGFTGRIVDPEGELSLEFDPTAVAEEIARFQATIVEEGSE